MSIRLGNTYIAGKSNLPDQTGKAGKYLKTDGSNLSWEDAGGGSIDAIDNLSITKNSDEEIQTVGVINQNATTTAIKMWSGTKAEYDALATKDANTLYNVTDDGIGGYTAGTGISINANNVISVTTPTLTTSDIINNVSSTATDKALSANMGKELNDRLDNVESRGRYLSQWNCSTGLPSTNPTTSPYSYQRGDYYIVGTVAASGSTNYKPNGSSYTTDVPSTTAETNTVSINDTYIYDGTTWILQSNAQKEVAFANLAGLPTDNSNLATALNAKQNTLTAGTGISITNDTISNTGLINTATGTDALAVGSSAEATATGAIQLGNGTNTTANTLFIGLNSSNYRLLNYDGTIPAERLTKTVLTGSTDPTSSTITSFRGQLYVNTVSNKVFTNNGTTPATSYTNVGGVVVSNNVASGFGTYKYLRINETFPQSPTSYDIIVKATWGGGNYCTLLSNNGQTSLWALYQKHLSMWVTGTGWIKGSTTLTNDKVYWFRITYDGTKMTSYFLIDNNYTKSTLPPLTSWTQEITYTGNWINNISCVIGNGDGLVDRCWDGSIDLNQTIFTVNGATWWDPSLLGTTWVEIGKTYTAGTGIDITNNTISANEMVGADGTNAGTKGAVPAPTATDNTKFLRGDGTWATAGSNYTAGTGINITSNVISANTMTGATSSANGTTGIVPAPLIADKDKFLRGDGTWAEAGGGGGGGTVNKSVVTNPALTATDGVCTWTITNAISDDCVLSIKEIATGEEVIGNVTFGTGTITVRLNSSVDIAADTYKAVIIG